MDGFSELTIIGDSESHVGKRQDICLEKVAPTSEIPTLAADVFVEVPWPEEDS